MYQHDTFGITRTVLGVEVKIEINASDDSSSFGATHAGRHVHDQTLAGLLIKLKTVIQKSRVRVAVPVTILGVAHHEGRYGRRDHWIGGLGVRHGVVTGKHARTGKLLFKGDDGESEQIDGLGRREVVRRLTDEESARYVQLATEEQQASRALSAFTSSVTFKESLSDVIEKAIEEKAFTGAEEAAADEEEAEAVVDPR